MKLFISFILIKLVGIFNPNISLSKLNLSPYILWNFEHHVLFIKYNFLIKLLNY